MQVFVLLSKGHSENNTQLEEVYANFRDAQADMRQRFESSRKFWDGMDTTNYKEIHIGGSESYAEAYAVDEDYEETGMSWRIEAVTVK